MGKLINDTIQIFNKVVKGALITIGNTCTVIGDSNNSAKEFITPNGEYTTDFNSIGSSAYLDIPEGSNVKYAILEWHSTVSYTQLNSNNYSPINLITPLSENTIGIYSDSSNQAEYMESNGDIQSVKWIDVTNIIKESKNGYYTVKNIPINIPSNIQNHNQRVGWSLSIVYENLKMQNRHICINIGIKRQDFTTPRENRALEITGFKIPNVPRKSYITIVAANGSPNFYSALNVYNDKSVINNMTLEYSIGNLIECRFANPNTLPIVPHDNVFSGIIMNTDTESIDYGKINNKGTLGDRNNNAFNTLNQSLYKGNRAKLDILSFDISEKMHSNQEKMFIITEIWNPSKTVAIDIILHGIQTDTDEPAENINIDYINQDIFTSHQNRVDMLQNIIDETNSSSYENSSTSNQNYPLEDIDIFANFDNQYELEKYEDIEEIEDTFVKEQEKHNPSEEFDYYLRNEEKSNSDSYSDAFDDTRYNSDLSKLENNIESVEDNFEEENEVIEEIEDEFEGDSYNSNSNNLVDNIESIEDNFEEENEVIEEIEDEFEGDSYNSNSNNLVDNIESIEDNFEEENEVIEEIEDEFEGFNYNSDSNNLVDSIESIEDNFQEENEVIEEIEDEFEGDSYNSDSNNLVDNIEVAQDTSDLEGEFEEIEDVFEGFEHEPNVIGMNQNYHKEPKEDFDYQPSFELDDIKENEFLSAKDIDIKDTIDENIDCKLNDFDELKENLYKEYFSSNETNSEALKDNKHLNLEESINEADLYTNSDNDFQHFNTFSTNISMNKFSNKNSYHIDEEVTYTITISNNSSTNIDNVILIDNVPINSSLIKDSLTVKGVTVTGKTLPINGINIGTISSNTSLIVSYKVKFYDMPIEQFAQVNPKITFVYIVNGVLTPETLVGTCNVITIFKDPIGIVELYANRTNASSGDKILYSLIIKNNGNKTATNVKIMDTLPQGLSFIPNTLIVNGVSTLGDLANGVFISNIAANSQSLITFEVKVN